MTQAKTTAKKTAPAKKAAAKKATPPKQREREPQEPKAEQPPTPGEGETLVKAKVDTKVGSPSERRADWLRALESERDQLNAVGKTDRAKLVEAEIARAKSAPAGRQAPATTDA